MNALMYGFLDEIEKLAASVSVNTLKDWKKAPLGEALGEPKAPSVRRLHRLFRGLKPKHKHEIIISPRERATLKKRLKIVRRRIPRGEAKIKK